MPLFFYSWKGDDLASFLVDARDEKRARPIATQHHGRAPDAVRELPPETFAAEVLFYPFELDELEEDERAELTVDDVQHGDTVSIELLEHVDNAFRLLEDSCTKSLEARAVLEVSAHCNDENETDDGTIVYCTRAAHGADEPHTGGGYQW